MKQIRFKYRVDYDAESGGKVLLNENDVETCVLLSHPKVEKWGYIDYELQNSDYLKDCNFQATYADVTEWVMASSSASSISHMKPKAFWITTEK